MELFTLKRNGKDISIVTTASLSSEAFSLSQGKQSILSTWVYSFKLSHVCVTYLWGMETTVDMNQVSQLYQGAYCPGLI